MQIIQTSIINKRWWITLLFFATAVISTSIWPDEAFPQDPETATWEISADHIRYDPKTDEYIAEGNVSVTRQGRRLTADSVRLNQTSRRARAQGDVQLDYGQDRIKGQQMDLDLDKETGTISNGTIFYAQNHLYLSGQSIEKTGPGTYHITKAVVTSCDGPDPAWRLTGSDLKVTVEGYGVSTHTALWAKRIPVFYTPFMVFPVKFKRQSGLLAPEFGLSDRKGTEYLQPFFWAINDHMDATFFAHYMSERGTRWGGEYRYAAGERSLGTFMIDGLEDAHIDDGEGDNTEKWGYDGDNALRTNPDRYWFRGKLNQALPLGLFAKLDLDWVSDQDYLKEFQDKLNGFEFTQSYYLETYGRGFDDYTVVNRRLNQLNINRLWTGYTLNTDVRWYDNVIQRTQDQNLTNIQQLPAVTFDGTKKKIANSPLYFDLLSGYTHFYSQYGPHGQRTDLYPRIYYPTRMFNAISVEPSLGLRHTYWRIDYYDTTPIEAHQNQREFNRDLFDIKLDTSTDFYRVFDIDTDNWDRLKHTLRPQIIYEYLPRIDEAEQQKYPQFDALDRIEAKNMITYALTNNFILRRPLMMGEPGQKKQNFDYTPFLRFRLEQSFDLNKEKEARDSDDEPPRKSQPFSDIRAELDLTPGNYVALDADAQWSTYDNIFYGYNAGVHLWDTRGDKLNVDYRFSREDIDDGFNQFAGLITEPIIEPIHSIIGNAQLQLNSQWLLRGSYERDVERRKILEEGVGISYMGQCWGIDLDYKRESSDERVEVLIHLIGLGTIGE